MQNDAPPLYERYGRSTFVYDSYIQEADYGLGSQRLEAQILRDNPDAKSLLDVACGSGKYLSHLQHSFQCAGLDLASGFVEIARERCPQVPIHQGDMTDFSLSRTFDAVSCLFVAIAYVRTVERLDLAIANMAKHLNPGGFLYVEPWVYPENFWIGKFTSEYIEEPDRSISRMFVTRVEDGMSVYDIHYMVGSKDGIEYFVEREELGLFTHEQYLAAFDKAGLTVQYKMDGGLFDQHNIGMYWGQLP